VAVGLMAFRVLPNFPLSSERGGKLFDMGKMREKLSVVRGQ
jgi:hypothetical protein